MGHFQNSKHELIRTRNRFAATFVILMNICFLQRLRFLCQPNREVLERIEEREGLDRKIPLVKV